MKRGVRRVAVTMVAVGLCLVCPEAPFAQKAQAVSSLDLNRLTGSWFEVARLPDKTERRCLSDNMMLYALGDRKGSFQVGTTCLLKDGTPDAYDSTGKLDKQGDGKLKLTSVFPLTTPYWVLAFGPEDAWALVGTPNHKSLWILSRTASLDPATLTHIKGLAMAQGYDPGKLITVVRTAETPVVATVATAAAKPAEPATPQHLRSRIFVYDLREGSSKLVYTDDSVWEAPNWSSDGTYLISNHDGGIYKLAFHADGTATPEKLAIPAGYSCNNDKALSPDGKHLAFSATPPGEGGSEVFLADADGTHLQPKTHRAPSYFHGWSPDGRTLAFVAQRGGDGQYDIYGVPAMGGSSAAEQRLTSDPHQDDGPDYSPDGRWIYINSDRSGKQAVWRFPASGAGLNDAKAEKVIDDTLQDWFPHPSPDGTKLVYIGYPADVPTHNPRDVRIALKLVTVDHDTVAPLQRTLLEATGGQGTMNVNSWAPDSVRFAYVTYEVLP